MQRESSRIVVGTAALAAAVAALLSFSGAAGATAASRHVATGSGTQKTTCVPDNNCVSSLSIDASDRPGALGHATYAQGTTTVLLQPTSSARSTDIAFGCVVIKDIPGGHTLYASGTGTGIPSGTLFVKLTVTGTSSGFAVSQTSTSDRLTCGAGGLSTGSATGTFAITPVG